MRRQIRIITTGVRYGLDKGQIVPVTDLVQTAWPGTSPLRLLVRSLYHLMHSSVLYSGCYSGKYYPQYG